MVLDLCTHKCLVPPTDPDCLPPPMNCGHPGLVPRANKSLPRVEGYNDLPIRKGTNITFSCPPGKVLIGPNSATCTENGEWEPDLRLIGPYAEKRF